MKTQGTADLHIHCGIYLPSFGGTINKTNSKIHFKRTKQSIILLGKKENCQERVLDADPIKIQRKEFGFCPCFIRSMAKAFGRV